MHYDQLSPSARKIAKSISGLVADDPLLIQVIQRMGAWDGTLATASPEAAIYEVFLDQVTALMVGRYLGDTDLGQFYKGHGPSYEWVQSMLVKPGQSGDNPGFGEAQDEVWQQALSAAITVLSKKLGPGVEDWSWGKLHQLTYSHPLGNFKPLRQYFNRGPFPTGGDGTTVWTAHSGHHDLNSSLMFGPPYRMIVDLGDLRNFVSLLAPGQSGLPASRHYNDQVKAWFTGDYHLMLFYRADVEKETEGRLELLPEGG